MSGAVDIEELLRLLEKHPEEWRIEYEPCAYGDDTKRFIHIVFDAKDGEGETMKVLVGEYLSADLAELLLALKTAAPSLIAEVRRLREALNERDMFINPETFDEAADEIDCGPQCNNLWHEHDTNAGGCYASERGDYCPNDVAETLRALAKVARAAPPEVGQS